MQLSAATYYVAPGGSDGNAGTNWVTARQTIQAGVNLALTAGDVLLVSNGTYALSSEVTVSRAVTVRGFSGNPADVTVNGAGITRCVNLNAAGKLAGMTLANGSATIGGGISLTAGGMITNCWILSNRGTADPSGGGIYMTAGLVVGCRLVGNRATGTDGGAIFMSDGTVKGCEFVTNTAAPSVSMPVRSTGAHSSATPWQPMPRAERFTLEAASWTAVSSATTVPSATMRAGPRSAEAQCATAWCSPTTRPVTAEASEWTAVHWRAAHWSETNRVRRTVESGIGLERTGTSSSTPTPLPRV